MKPEIQSLRESLQYDQDTGILSWRVRPLSHFKKESDQNRWNTRWAGRPTGCPDPQGYLRINIMGTPHLAHQLAWAIVHGEFVDEIDHINNDPADNRLSNLRKCTRAENQHNRPRNRNNTSGFKNVCWHKQQKRWRAYIVVDYKQKSLGLHDTPAEAYKAYCDAVVRLHGEFSNTG